MSLLKHIDFDTTKRDEYLKIKRSLSDDENSIDIKSSENLTEDEFNQMAASEEFILTVTASGYGKRSSSYEYRVTGRGGQGIANIEMSERNKEVVASFPVTDSHQIMLVTDNGKLIRMPVDNIRVAGRKTQGVILFRTNDDEKVVSATWIEESDDNETDDTDFTEDDVVNESNPIGEEE